MAVEPIGVFILKQTVQLNGVIGGNQPILLADDEVFNPPKSQDDDLKIHVESDLASYKPNLDLVVVRDSPRPGFFGRVRIDQGSGFGSAQNLDFGWRDRLTSPRIDLAGNVQDFQPVVVTDPANPPNLTEKLKLPDNFQNQFFNGGRLGGLDFFLQSTNLVQYEAYNVVTGNFLAPQVIEIPEAPVLTITINDLPLSPPVDIELGVDTLVYNVSAQHFLITWRAIFLWESRLESANLEVT